MESLWRLSTPHVLLTSTGRAGDYVHWGVVQISLTNLLVVVAMLVLFALALLVPFVSDHRKDES